MVSPKRDEREAERLVEFERLGAVRPEADRVLQELVDDAREAFGTVLCMANLVTEDAQYVGAWAGELPEELAEARRDLRGHSMCRHVVEEEAPLVVEDLLATERSGDQHFRVRYGARFYAEAPLVTSNGQAVGSLCLLDARPREFGEKDMVLLRAFAKAVVGRLEALGALERERSAREDLRGLDEALERRVAERTRRLEAAVAELEERGRALRRSEERFRLIARATGEAIRNNDLATGEQRWAGATEALFGYPPHRGTTGDWWEERLHPEDRGRVLSGLEAVLAPGGGEAWEEEYRFRRADGSYAEVVDRGFVVRDAVTGEPVRMVGSMADVTERRRTERALGESERRYATLLSNAPAYVYRRLNEPGWPDVFCSDYALELTGYPPEEFVGGEVDYGELIVEGDRGRVREEVRAALEKRERYKLRYRIRRRDGELRHVEEFGRGVHDEGGEVLALEGLIQDVTEREEAEERLREAEERYRTLVERIPAAVYLQGPEAGSPVAYMNPWMEALLGYPLEDWEADPYFCWSTVHPDDRERLEAEDERTDETGEPFRAEYRLIAHDGSVVWARDEAVLVRDEAGEPLFWHGVLTDITERKALEERLEHLALHDPLTGLPNRRLFSDRLEQALGRASRGGGDGPVAVLYADLDGFKGVNDALGHEAGDELLVAVAGRLRGCVRPSDTVARLGGDEFAVLLEGASGAAEAEEAAGRILRALRAPVDVGGARLSVTASVGVALGSPAGHREPANLLREADLAMYRAKGAGKARYALGGADAAAAR